MQSSLWKQSWRNSKPTSWLITTGDGPSPHGGRTKLEKTNREKSDKFLTLRFTNPITGSDKGSVSIPEKLRSASSAVRGSVPNLRCSVPLLGFGGLLLVRNLRSWFVQRVLMKSKLQPVLSLEQIYFFSHPFRQYSPSTFFYFKIFFNKIIQWFQIPINACIYTYLSKFSLTS